MKPKKMNDKQRKAMMAKFKSKEEFHNHKMDTDKIYNIGHRLAEAKNGNEVRIIHDNAKLSSGDKSELIGHLTGRLHSARKHAGY